MRIAVFGMGYVGLVTAACLAELGHEVVCFDPDHRRVAPVERGEVPFYEPGLAEIVARNVKSGRLKATSQPDAALDGAEITFIAVGTPTVAGAIDLSQVTAASREIGRQLGGAVTKRVIVVKSTVVPGTTDGTVATTLAQAAGVSTDAVSVAINPEFLRQGRAVEDFMRPDRIIVGSSKPDVAKRVMAVYDAFDCPKIVTTSANAELIKYANNALLATAISFSNEIANICERTAGADAVTVMAGVHLDRRLSRQNGAAPEMAGLVEYLKSGCGFGGSCLPKDVRALASYAADRELTADLLQSVIAINTDRPRRLVEKARALLGGLKGRSIAVLGLAFKPGTDDLRDSPGVAVVEELSRNNAESLVWDPYVPAAQVGQFRGATKCESLMEVIGRSHAAILTGYFPEMDGLDWSSAIRQSSCAGLIDGRGVLTKVAWPSGFQYATVGRGG